LGPAASAAEPGLIRVSDTTPEKVGDLAAANGITLHELVAEGIHQSLEEVFLELTRDAEAESP
jgi:ABC-2 type transport system ATP-binding protein